MAPGRAGSLPGMGLVDGHHSGPREAVVKALRDMATGWHLRGNDAMRDDATEQADAVAAGADHVSHGLATYEVTPD
jgi:hypothetical protein